jgi:hypothetical protein
MRSRPLRGEPTGERAGAQGCAWLLLLALALALGGVRAAPAGASPCPNAALRSGPSERLPDCRAYEQVSPIEKDGADAVTLQPLLPAQSAPCEAAEACAIAYMSVTGAFAGAQGNSLPNAYVSTRGENGWQTTALTPPTRQPPANGPARVSYAFSANLSQAVLRVPLQALTDNAPAGVYNLFLRAPGGGYSLVTALPAAEPPRSECGSCFTVQDVPVFAGASSDFSHILFEANDSLLAGAPGGGVDNLYETVGERVRLVGILPDGGVPAEGAMPGAGIDPIEETSGELDRAISQSGSRVLFEAKADGGEPDREQAGKTELYDRLEGSSTVEVSAPAPGAEPSRCETAAQVCEAGEARFWGASADGSLVFFTSKAALTGASFTGAETRGSEDAGNDLYLYDLDTGALTDLTVDAGDAEDPNGAQVLGVAGCSEDGSYVYFVADGDLAEGASSGQPNLYVWHGTGDGAGTTRFIATLEAGEEGDALDWTEHPSESQAYVTPNGTHLAFMSVKSLTGYDNEDQAAGAPGHERFDHEVFEYGAETGQLVCASCDPSGARPLGSAFLGAKLSERASTPFHQPRVLSDDGSRLFFSSPDPLVPGLAGGRMKVFEYEDGAPALISGAGEGAGNDVFLDASASGDDVFFATSERLVPTDADELVDVYDARVDGGFPAPVLQAPTCEAGACQGASAQAPPLVSPISATFIGVGNLPAPATAKPRPTDAQLLARALASCRRLHSRRRRASCMASARRRYGPKPKRRVRASGRGARGRSKERRDS